MLCAGLMPGVHAARPADRAVLDEIQPCGSGYETDRQAAGGALARTEIRATHPHQTRRVSAVDEQAMEVLRRSGWAPGEVLGTGMEGTVVELSPDAVAKIWHGRSREDLNELAAFGAALSSAALPFETPRVMDLLVDDGPDGGLVVTIEHRVPGKPLRPDRTPAPPVASADAARLVGDALAGLAAAAITPGLAALPILPGDRPFEWPGSFPASLANLVDRRFQAFPDLLRRDIDEIDTLVAALLARLRGLPEDAVGLIHGYLIPANVFVQEKRVTGVLDFGFMSTIGDPQFDAAMAASIFDMYGPNARASEDMLTDTFLARFGHDRQTYDLYRAAYAVTTNAYFGTDGTDGHFAWCAQMLRRPEVQAAVLS